MDYLHLSIFIIAGAFGGFMAGMLGVGGGIIFIPIIQEIVRTSALAEEKAFYVLANSLAIVLVVGISGSVKQYKLKNTDIKATLVTGVFAILSSVGVTVLLKYYDINNQQLFNYIFASILLLTALRMWVSKSKKKPGNEPEKVQLPSLKSFVPAGLLAGVVTAITGLGGGVVMVPYFNKFLKLPMKFSTGLSLSVIPIIAAPLLGYYMLSVPGKEVFPGAQTGFIMWTAVLPIIVAAGLASPLGVKVANKISSENLLRIFLAFILINLTKILFF